MLPDRTTRLPRAKPIPRPKALTRWQKFAQEKGIVKKTRDRMVWDEDHKEWAPRWGYKRARDSGEKDWLLEYKKNDDPSKDLFEERSLKKKQRVIQNEVNRLGNETRGAAGAGSGAGAGSELLNGPAGGSKKQHKTALVADGAPRSFAGGKPFKQQRRNSSAMDVEDGAGAGAGAGSRAAVPTGIAPLRMSEGRADGLFDQGKHARPKPGEGGVGGLKEGKEVKAERLKHAQVSTASMGRVSQSRVQEGVGARQDRAHTWQHHPTSSRLSQHTLVLLVPRSLPSFFAQFDKSVSGEPSRPKDARKQKRLPNNIPMADEAQRHANILKTVLHGTGEGEQAGRAPARFGGDGERDRDRDARPAKKAQGHGGKHGHGHGGKQHKGGR